MRSLPVFVTERKSELDAPDVSLNTLLSMSVSVDTSRSTINGLNAEDSETSADLSMLLKIVSYLES